MSETLIGCLERAVCQFGEKPAIIDGELVLTYAELGGEVGRLANGLRGLGIKQGDTVAALCVNHYRYLEIYFACHAIGAIINPLNIRLAAAELVYILNDSKSRVLFIDRPFLPMLEAIQSEAKTVESIYYSDLDQPSAGLPSIEALMEGQDERWVTPEIDEDAVASYCYTGGTTGMPKGVMLSTRNSMSNAFHLQSLLHYTERDVYLHIAPMFHLADAASIYAVTMMGATHVFGRSFEPKLTLELLQNHRVTMTLLVPTMVNFLLSHPDFDNYDLSAMRGFVYGASPMPVPLLKRAMEKFPCLPIQGYGMTETSPLLTCLSGEEHRKGLTEPGWDWLLGTAGRAVPGVEVRVVDGNDHEVPVGHAGEVVARGPNIMKGYLNKPEATEEAIHNGWMHTGDVAVRNPHGYITIVDRKKDMIISGGENIYTTEVENVLMQFEGILETTVIGVPDEKWGEVVKAFVVMKPGHTAEAQAIIDFAKERLANYKCPKSVEFIDALPKSGAGKILKRDLRKQYWGEGRQVH